MKSLLKRFIFKSASYDSQVIKLAPQAPAQGCVAISYLIWPFIEGHESPKARGHTNAFEIVAMAEAWKELGFRVEITSYDDSRYQPPSDCRIAIDIHRNLERWTNLSNCRKILHATGPHWMQWNASEYRRLESVRERCGIALAPRRQVSFSRGCEIADEICLLGNEYTINSFRFANKPITRIPLSSAYEFDWPVDRDFEKARKKFLWVASYGMVHKGLDLVLDAFAGMPDLELTVCGRPEKEEDFFRLYQKELTQTSNIHFHGWLDMGSPDFLEMARTHATIIYPSCAEGGAGAVIHCMHAGMLPACTWEASVDLGDFGLLIREGSVEAVREAAQAIAAMPANEVEDRARRAWEHVRRVHTREAFRRNYADFAQTVVQRINVEY